MRIESRKAVCFGRPLFLAKTAPGAYAGSIQEAVKNGASPDQAIRYATANVAMEIIAERVPVNELLDSVAGNPKRAAEIMDAALKQYGIRMTGEELNWLGGVAAEASKIQQHSGFAKVIALEMLKGQNYEQARTAASRVVWQEVVKEMSVMTPPYKPSAGYAKLKTKVTEIVGGIRNAIREGRLTINSTEQQRYELLKDAVIQAVPVNESAIEGVNLEDYNTGNKKAVTKGFRALADNLGIANVDLNNCELDFTFQFSKTSLNKSLNHQSEYGGSYQDYVKAMSCFNELVENAVPIETHEDKKKGTPREDSTLKQVYVLVSAIQDGKNVIPIELEVKTFKTKNAQLYMTVALTKIDSGVLERGLTTSAEHPSLFPESTYTIHSFFENVNPKDARFLKYVPDQFLNEAQLQKKQEALDKQEKEYAGYGKAGPTQVRKRFQDLLEKAKNDDIIEFDDELEDIVAGKSFEELEPLLQKLPNRAARKWYIAQNNLIPSQIDRSLDIEGQARQAFDLRNQNRTRTRDLMLDQEERKRLDITDPNITFEEKVAEKMSGKDMSRQEAIEDILRTATKTRKSVNEGLGLE